MSVASPLNQLSVLRKKLDLMGYHEPLPLEAIPLVALLFRDFLQLTESFNNVKAEHSQLLKLKKNFEDNVQPYKEENINLISLNNELHQEMMKMRENSESALLEMKTTAKKIEDENASLRFLNNQYFQKTGNLKKMRQKSEVMLQEQNAEKTMQMSDGKKSPFCCPEQCTELAQVMLQPPTTESLYLGVNMQNSESHPMDLLHLSASTIVKLQNENAELLDITEQAHKTAKFLGEKASLREKEIERLTVQLNLGKPLQAIRLETKEQEKDDVIQNLQKQLESLYHQNEELEKIIIKYCGKECLPEKIRPRTVYNSLDTMCENSISRQVEDSCALDKPELHGDNSSCRKHTEQIYRLEKALKQANLEKRRLAEKITPLLAKEKQLESDISKLKKKIPAHGAPPSQSSERLARLVQVLEAQRDFFKEECDTLKRLQEKNAKILCKSAVKSSSDTKITEIATKDHETAQIKKKSFVTLVEEERDFYKEKYCKLLERQHNMKEECSRATADKEIMVMDDISQKVRKENFELFQRIKELEHQMSQNNSEKKLATSEKQRNERKNLEKAVTQLQNTVEELQKELENISKEKQALMQRYQQAIIEKSKLQEETGVGSESVVDGLMPCMDTDSDVQKKIKEMEQQYKSEDAILHQQIEQMENIITDLKRENETVKDTLAYHKVMVSSLEHQVSSLNYQLSQVVAECDQHKTVDEHIRLAIGHREQSAEQVQLILMQKDDKISLAEKKRKILESDVEELKDILKHRETEIKDLKSVVVILEEEKEELTKVMNEKDIQLSSLQQQIYSKELHASELKITSSSLEANMEKVHGEMKLKDEEIGSLKEQLQSKTKHAEETLHSLDVLRRENSRLLEELSMLTKENKFVTETLENKLQELEEMRRKDTGYVAELSRIQEILSIKEQQRSELLEQYKNLSYDNARLETETQRLQSEVETAHTEMQSNVAALQKLRSTVQSLEQEIEEHLAAQEAHRLEMTFLNTSVSGLEAELHQKEQEIGRLQVELAETRSLSVHIDASRENLQKMLADEGATNAKMASELEDLRDEIRAVRAQLLSERTSVLTMESLMSTHREQEFRGHLMNQELNAEISILRNRLKESTEKVEVLTKELCTLRTETAKLKMEKEKLKRDITDERYERERDHSELLRLQHHQQVNEGEPSSVKSLALFHPDFSSPKLKLFPSQEAVPVPSATEVMAQSEVSSKTHSTFAADKEMSHQTLLETSAQLCPSEEGKHMLSKGTTKQYPSSKTQSAHKTSSLEQLEKEPIDD